MRVLGRLLALALLLCGAPLAPAFADAPAAKPISPIDAAIERARSAMLSEPEKALTLAGEADTLARRMPEGRDRTVALASVLWLKSEAYLRLNDSARAHPLIVQALTLIAKIREPLRVRGDLLLSRGTLEMDDGQAAAALSSYQEAHDIFQQLGEKRRQAIAESYRAQLFLAANDLERAEESFLRAAEIYDGDPMLSATLHNNRGNVLLLLERYGDAEAEYVKAIDLARRNGNALFQARLLGNLARAQVEARRLDEASATLARAFELANGDDARGFRQQLLATSARVAMERGDLQQARRQIAEAFQGVDPAKTSIAFREAHLFAYMIYERTGQPALALVHLEALKRLDDEAAKVSTNTNASLMAARFDSANQKIRIEELKAEELRKSAEFQRTLFLSIGAATLAIIALLTTALLVIRRSRNRVREANVVLGETNEALEKALKAKTEFLATTSHEIRTPLNGILGMTQVMLSDPKLEAATRERIGIVHGAGVTMRALVDDILDVAKMETGNLTVDAAPMDLCATLKEVTRIWEEQALAKGLTFELHLSHAPHWIVSDAGRLRQIVFNLLSNAIKFTARGSVGVRAVEEGEGDARRLKLIVADSGIGIPREKCEEIFESFKQVDAGTTRKFGGTGLGLTICRNLARALGGDIAVESRDGEGSTFTVDLPLVLAEAPAASTATASGAGTMLVLDRNPIARSMLKTLLEPRVGTLKFLATPDEAFAALGEGRVAQLLVDEATLKAAGDDPFGLLARLAKGARGAGAATSILWMKPDDEIRARILAAGIGQIVEKPVSGAALIESIVSQVKENLDISVPSPLVSHAA